MNHEQEIIELEKLVTQLKSDLLLVTNQFTKDLLLNEISDKEEEIQTMKNMKLCPSCGNYEIHFLYDDELGEICENCYMK